MKKLFAIIASLVVSTFAFNAKAQLGQIEGMPPYKLGITVGFNMPWMTGTQRVTLLDLNQSKTYLGSYSLQKGFQVGANLMLDASAILPNTFARVEAKYTQKGGKAETSYKGVVLSDDVKTHYIEMPIHYGYAWLINDYLTLMAETGPYFAIGFSGVSKVESENGKMPNAGVFERPVNGTRFDLGWGIQGSAMIAKNYQVHVAFDYGFINIQKDYLQNRNFSVGFTWFFESLFD